ncbi:dNA polymerase III delta' subunit [Firmicutes bacterium CAG:460]|uniref:DNA polymerase III, delta' subunit n=1 Tax=Candidatus Onthocola sp. TaxID=3085646 RepID=UPI00033746BE|nr:dNA polymerase III delta' subunit [Firmicutes bacterium CAG:460]
MEVNVLENLVKYYHENKISHAYLIETNNLEKCYLDLLEVIKQIFCQNEYNKECNKCNICNLVNQNYLPSLVVISPDGMNIKKEQIVELKKKFSTVPIYTKENIYVIKNAEKLNGASANTMLKFLEEPEQNILGFFITNNANNVISTIRSRCEVIKVLYDIHELDINNITNDINKDKFDVAIEYLFKIEVEKKLGIMYNRDVVLNKFSEREDIKTVFKIIFIIYEELLKKVMGLDNKFDFEKINELSSLDKDKVLRRINLVTKFIDDIDSNVNVELLLDKFVIELGDYIE